MSDPQPTFQPPRASETQETDNRLFNQRSRRQLGLFAAGATFFGLASIITRRSLVRRYQATVPKFYQPSTQVNHNVNGAMEAFEALNIATINVLSVGMMAGGGLLWAFDIATLEDMRRKVRTGTGLDGRRIDQDEEEELEEWFATVLARKEFKALRGEKGIKDKGELEGGSDVKGTAAKKS